MLAESQLPQTFWGEAVVSLVHVLNRAYTIACPTATPYELFYKRKPDVSHLRVWGCAAYVHVQKDKRQGLSPHMEKCIFIGYPDGFKGWKFYNPLTKRVVISETAVFDERFYPGLKHSAEWPPFDALPPPPAAAPAPVQVVPDLGGDEDDYQPRRPLANLPQPAPAPPTRLATPFAP